MGVHLCELQAKWGERFIYHRLAMAIPCNISKCTLTQYFLEHTSPSSEEGCSVDPRVPLEEFFRIICPFLRWPCYSRSGPSRRGTSPEDGLGRIEN